MIFSHDWHENSIAYRKRMRADIDGAPVTPGERNEPSTSEIPATGGECHHRAGHAACRVAQAYPSRPVRILVGFAAGGNFDIVARLIGQWLSEQLGQPVIVENRPGAASNLATEAAVRAPADGYTLLLGGAVNAVNATLYERLGFNFLNDVAPVAGVVRFPNVMTVNASFPARTVAEFIVYAKANPNKINHGSSGNGTTQHLAGELFKMMTGASFTHVPYRGGSQAITDLLSGQVQVLFEALPPSIQHIKSGSLRALAVTTATRSEALPDLPAMGEFVPGYEASGWNGMCAPRNTPAEIIDRLNSVINAGLADSKDQGAPCRPRRHNAGRLPCRLRKTHLRRNRKVEQGNPVGQHQGGVRTSSGRVVSAGGCADVFLSDGKIRGYSAMAPCWQPRADDRQIDTDWFGRGRLSRRLDAGACAGPADGDTAERLTLQATTDPAEQRCRRIEDPMPLMPVSLHRTFHDDFDEHPLSNGTWVPHYAGGAAWPAARYWGGDGSDFKRKTAWNGEQQIYVDPRYGGRATTPLGLDPFKIRNGILSIVASRTPPELKSVLFNNEYISGILTTQRIVFAKVRIFRNPLQDTGRDRRMAGVLDARR